MARPDPKACSQNWGKGVPGARASISIGWAARMGAPQTGLSPAHSTATTAPAIFTADRPPRRCLLLLARNTLLPHARDLMSPSIAPVRRGWLSLLGDHVEAARATVAQSPHRHSRQGSQHETASTSAVRFAWV